MMEHDKEYYYRLISAMLDNELNSDQQNELDEFIAQNPDFQDEFDGFAESSKLAGAFLKDAGKSVEHISVWSAVADAVSADFDIERRLPRETGKIIPAVFGKKRRVAWISSALAASILIFFGFYLFIFPDKPYNQTDNMCIVESVESESSSVMVFKDTDTNTTIIWMFSSRPSEGGITS
ncbi:MAG: hypothetical protein RBU23_03550 [Candidatus Auribacterota bacterium]|jgi:hypothetical protein|nr:hypothetical protein [Candidatus Auribacterota bacterium]